MPDTPYPMYLTCTVTVHDEHTLTFHNGFADLAKVPFGADPLTLASIERLSYWVEDGQHCSGRDLELLGRHLYRYMFGDERSRVHQGFRAMLAKLKEPEFRNFRLRLTLAFEPPASKLALLPWEFLHVEEDGGFFFAAPSRATQLKISNCGGYRRV